MSDCVTVLALFSGRESLDFDGLPFVLTWHASGFVVNDVVVLVDPDTLDFSWECFVAGDSWSFSLLPDWPTCEDMGIAGCLADREDSPNPITWSPSRSIFTPALGHIVALLDRLVEVQGSAAWLGPVCDTHDTTSFLVFLILRMIATKIVPWSSYRH
jgi:hypothetical protein